MLLPDRSASGVPPRLCSVTEFVYRTATTLNGFIADPDHSLGWLFAVDHTGLAPHAEFLARVGAIVEGSHTYEWVLLAESLLNQPERWTGFFGPRPTFVFTSRELPRPAGADVRFLHGPVSDHLAAVCAAAGDGDVWIVGGGELAGQFADAGALDEIELALAPVALPGGAPLLPRRLESDRLRLAEAEVQGQFLRAVYRVVPPSS